MSLLDALAATSFILATAGMRATRDGALVVTGAMQAAAFVVVDGMWIEASAAEALAAERRRGRPRFSFAEPRPNDPRLRIFERPGAATFVLRPGDPRARLFERTTGAGLADQLARMRIADLISRAHTGV